MPISRIKTDGIQDDAITSAKIGDTNVATADIANSSVTTAKIADDAVTGAKIENNPTIAGNATVAGDLTVDTSTLKVDSSNNRVGVGTASPTSDLHVSGGAGAHVAIQSSAGSHWRLGDAVGSSNGIFVVRDHTNSANRIQILADGKTQIAQGVTFGSDTAAANTLDDYDEGTWTPTFSSGISSPVYSIQTGRYTKVGRAVYVESDIRVTGGSVTSAHVYMGGLPFTVSSAAPYSKLDMIYQGGFHNISYPSVWLCIAGTTTAAFYRNTDGGAILGNQITSSFTNATIRIGGWYIT